MWYYGQKRAPKSGLIPFPRVGRANTWQLDDGPQRIQTSYAIPSKRQSLIPFPRVGKRSWTFDRRILRSGDEFKRRITRSWWDNDRPFTRRILRSGDYAFQRRLIKRSGVEEDVHGLGKRQSLIPFPRTGKRSVIVPNQELDQVYVYEEPDTSGSFEGGIEDEIPEDEVDADEELGNSYGEHHPWFGNGNSNGYAQVI